MVNLATSVRDNKHIPVLDGLRGFAVLYVMLYHYFNYTAQHSSDILLKIFFGFSSFGFSGVDLFFVLSGFLITGILVKNKEQEHYFRNFYIRRFLRIFPLYYFLLVIFILIVPHNYLWMSEGNRYPYWLFIMNFPACHTALHPFLVVTWSLAIEEQYYLIMPSIVYWLDKKRLLILLVAVFIFSFLMRTLLFTTSFFDAPTLHSLTFTHMDGLAIGGIIRLLFESEGKFKKMRTLFVKILPYITIINIALIAYCKINPASNEALLCHPLMITLGFATISIMYGSLIMYCIHKNNFISGFFSTSFMRMNGKYSYAIYLFNFIGIWIANNLLRKAFIMSNLVLLKNHLLLLVLGTLVTYALAIISWNLLEKPCLSLKRIFY